MSKFGLVSIKILVGLTAAALIILDTLASVAAMIGESDLGQGIALLFPIVVTIAIFCKRALILSVLHAAAATAIITRNALILGSVQIMNYWIFVLPFLFCLILWAWWQFESQLLIDEPDSATR